MTMISDQFRRSLPIKPNHDHKIKSQHIQMASHKHHRLIFLIYEKITHFDYNFI